MALHLETALQRKLNFKMTTVSACRPPRVSIHSLVVETYGGRYESVAHFNLRTTSQEAYQRIRADCMNQH